MHRLVWVYICQKATLLEVTCRRSYSIGILRSLDGQIIWAHTKASAWDFRIYHNCDQLWFKRDWASAQSQRNLGCLHTHSSEANNDSGKKITSSGIFFVFSGAEIRPHSWWNLGAFFPILKIIPIFIYFIFIFFDWDFHSVNTHKHMVTFSFDLIALVCVKAILFF